MNKCFFFNSNINFCICILCFSCKELYELGARRIVVFSAPPVGCVPSQRTLAGGAERECAENFNEAAKLFNSKLSKKLDSLASSLPNSRLVYIDVYNLLLDIIQKPQKYGK
jgi:phospholipase/lecithinase/hemolysin